MYILMDMLVQKGGVVSLVHGVNGRARLDLQGTGTADSRNQVIQAKKATALLLINLAVPEVVPMISAQGKRCPKLISITYQFSYLPAW